MYPLTPRPSPISSDTVDLLRAKQLRRFLGLLAAALALSTHLVSAQGIGRANLFNHDNLPAGDGATTELGARRARFIRVNSPLLTAGDSPLHQPAPPGMNLDSSRLELNLFPDLTLTAAFDKTLYRNGTNFFATGVIDGWDHSRIVLVAQGDVVAATIDVPGLGSYQIRYAESGLHKVIDLDKEKIPSCGPLKRAPAKPRPIRLRKKAYPPIPGDEPGTFASAPVALALGRPGIDRLFIAAAPPLAPDASGNTNVDVMVVYTSAARVGAGGLAAMNTLIDLAITEANDAFANSLIPVTLNLVFRGEVTYTETANAATDLTRLQNPADGHMDSVHALRNQYGADLVCLFTETMNTYAGLGYLMSTVTTNFSSYAFSVVRRVYAAGSYTFAHELGHNLGSAHDRQNSSSQGAYPYSYGHRFVGSDNNTYRTVMAYAPGTRIPHFSNPNVDYLGTATGIAIGATNAADNATSISNTVPIIASFRAPVVIFSFNSPSNGVSETNASVTVHVTRSSVTNLSVTVDYATANGTALSGSDYVATNGTLTFAAGVTDQTVTVPISDDDLKEGTETLTLVLSNPSVGTLFTSNATVHVLDDDASSVGFLAHGWSVSEGTNTLTVEVVRSGTTNTAITVNYFTTNGTAAAGSDFIGTNGILSFAAGEISKTVTVTVLNDLLAENNETFFIRLRSPTNTSLVAGTTNFIVTITTNDSAILGFSAATTASTENGGALTLTVNRSGTTNNQVSVDFVSTNVSATAGADYTATNGTLTFAPGETSQTFSVALLEDDSVEGTETFRFWLRSPSDARLGTGTNTVSITDNDASSVGFDTATNLVSETNGTLILSIVRAGATNTAVTVDYFTTNGTALAGSDFVATNGSLTFAPGIATNTITVPLTNDDTQENNELFRVRLLNPTNTVLALGTNAVTIADDDGSTIGFTVAALSVAENTNSVTLAVVRTGATNTAGSVNFTTTNGTATAGSDYRGTNGILAFAAGVATNTFALTILNDTAGENNETINLRLNNPTNCTLGTSNLVVTIITNDSAVLRFTAVTNIVNEGDGTLTLNVLRTGTTNNAVTVDFTTTNGTASSSSDYTATNGTLTFAPGETNQSIVLELTDDDVQEINESFRVVLGNPSDARITFGTYTVTLADDDSSTVGFTVATNSVSETNGVLTLVILRSGATNTAVTLDFTTSNGTASSIGDYGATNALLTFAAGVTTNLVSIDISDDQSQENTESFQVRLHNPTNTSLALGTNVVTILDDDTSTVGFSVTVISVVEHTNSVTVTVVRTGATNTIASTHFSTLPSSTATVGSDFRGTNGVLTFGLGETTNTFALVILNDSFPENNETVNLRLTSPTNCTLGTSNLVVTITTNDSAVLRFTAVTNTVDEADGTLTLNVLRTGTTNNAVTVAFTTTNLTASSSSDYTATNGTLTFAPGETNQSIVLQLTDDNTQEGNETFRTVLSAPVDATLTFATNTVTITDDDTSTVAFTTNAVTVSETNGILTLTVLRSGATNTAVTVDFTTTNATASAGSDYGTTNSTLSFAAGVTTNLISIDITDNVTQESAETFQVRLSNASNTSIGTGTNVVTITDEDSSTVGFAVSALSVSENTNSLTLTVVRAGATNTAVTVNFATVTNGTATAGSDYHGTNGILSFAAGVATNTFTLTILNDATPENNETLILRLTSPTNCTLGTSNLVVTITTNDSAVLRFTAVTNTVDEADGTLTLNVLRTGTTNNAITVAFTTTNLTASSSSDYTATNGTLTFAPGETNQSIVLQLTDDNTQEGNETFRTVLSAPVDATLTFAINTVTITDDDTSTVAFTTNAVTVSETNGILTLTVLRSGATNTAVTVDFTTTNATASAGSDYGATNGTLSFAAGVTTNLISIDITDNATQESAETFQVRLSSASNTRIGTGTNVVTITDEDSSTVGFVVSALSVSENTNSLTLTVVRAGATNTAVTVSFATTTGTATAGSDYRGTNGILSFAAGVTTSTFTLTILNDATPENNETVNLRLTSPTNCTLGASNLVVTITTNDSAVLRFTAVTNTVNEADGTLTLNVLRTGTTNNAITVAFTTTNLTASSSSDYTATNGTLTFAPGETNQSIVLQLTDDNTQESNETFRTVLSAPVDATLTFAINTVTITDDDTSTVAFTTNAVTVSETNGILTLTVLRSGSTNTAVTVDFTTTNATASAGSDYGATNGTLSFAAGVTTNLISIDITDNVTQESAETFQVRLSSASNTRIGTGTNVVTIADDDGSSIGFSVSMLTVAENTNSVTVTVVRSGATNTSISINFTNLNTGSATAGSDYLGTNGVLPFLAGVTTNTFSLVILDDAVAENGETIGLRLQNPTNTALGNTNLVVTITTNDSSVFSWSTSVTNLVEADGTLTLSVNRTGTTNNQVTVNFATTNVTATAGADYVSTNGTLTFAAGETSKDVTVEVTDDALQEANEALRLVLSSPADATLGTGTNTFTITDDDGSTVSLTTNAVTVAETNGSVVLVVLRTGATNTSVAVNFTTTNATATAATDYTGTNGTLVFLPGEATNTLTLAIANDLLYESSETFRFLLSGITNSSLATATNTVTITDNDLAELGFTAPTATPSELDGGIIVTVERTGVTNTSVSVAFATTNGTALAGSDYTATNGIISFAPGETNKDIHVLIEFDAEADPAETFQIRLSSFTNAAAAANTNLTVTIADGFGDPPAGSLISISSITRPDSNHFLLRVTGPSGAPVLIESTTNFQTWTSVTTGVIAGGVFESTVPINRAVLGQFFRVTAPMP